MRILLLLLTITWPVVTHAENELPGHQPQLVMFVADEMGVSFEEAIEMLDSSIGSLLKQWHTSHMMVTAADNQGIDSVALLVYATHRRAAELLTLAKEHTQLLDRNAMSVSPSLDQQVAESARMLRVEISRRQGWIRNSVFHLGKKGDCLPYRCPDLLATLRSLEDSTAVVLLASYQQYDQWRSFRN